MYNAHTRIIPIVSAFATEDKWSFQMKLLAGMSEFFIGYGFWLCGTIFALTLLIRFSFSRYTGPGRRMLDKAPPLVTVSDLTRGELSVQYFIHAAD
ncbi:hypothetical protein KZ773_26795 [Escherichia coli]|nr:hypothetical protein [Escherichia coli]